VQGSSPLSTRIRFATTFAVAFVAAACAVFAITSYLGVAIKVTDVSLVWRRVIGALGLIAFAVFDVVAIRIASYCPISIRRQTPKVAMRRYSPIITAAIWGFDTGLAVTTFRVAAASWGVFVLVFLGLCSWKVGLAYGLAFVVPLLVLLWLKPVDWVFMEKLLRQRAMAQCVSAVLLVVCGLIMIAPPLASGPLAAHPLCPLSSNFLTLQHCLLNPPHAASEPRQYRRTESRPYPRTASQNSAKSAHQLRNILPVQVFK
jgi:hypothetical protein